MREEHGIHVVEALLNGEQFQMEVDTGASTISLPGEVAEKLNLKPTDQDQTVQMILANGATIEGKLMSLKSVRVGRFTIEDVPCVVLQKGMPKAATLLGGSFLNHFIVKMDNAANELHLTELKDANQPKTGSATTKGEAPAGGNAAGAGNGSIGSLSPAYRGEGENSEGEFRERTPEEDAGAAPLRSHPQRDPSNYSSCPNPSLTP